MQKVGFVNRKCLVKIISYCFIPKLMHDTCCTFGVKSISNSLNVAFNYGFRKIFNIARHTSV